MTIYRENLHCANLGIYIAEFIESVLFLPMDCDGSLWNVMLELQKYISAFNYSRAVPINILFFFKRVARYNVSDLNVLSP